MGQGKFRDLTNQKFGKLTATEYLGRRGTQSMWKCICDCGTVHICNSSNLVEGKVRSCGCSYVIASARRRKKRPTSVALKYLDEDYEF